MSIHFISGKPRGGKTLYSVKLIIEELAYGERVVVTNVAFKLPELNQYLQKKYPHRTVDLFKRLRIMTDAETAEFWTYRPNGRVPRLTKEQWKEKQTPDYSIAKDDGGVLYAIDEVHNFFNSRTWMDTGQDVLFYLSQHAKLGDTVICITQSIENVDKQFRSVTQDFSYISNFKKVKVSWFKMPGFFLRQTYLKESENAQCVEQGTFTLDVSGVASTYETAKGVGIHGGRADKDERIKGVPAWVGAVAFVGLLILFFFGVPKIAFAFLSKQISPRKVYEDTRQYLQVTNTPAAQVTEKHSVVGDVVGSSGGGGNLSTRSNLWFFGSVALPSGKLYVSTSDGLLDCADHSVRFRAGGCEIDGAFYKEKR